MRTTLTLNDKLYRILKRRALDEDMTFSAYVEASLIHNEIGKDALTNEEIDRRLQESTISHEEVVRQLKAEGLI